MPHVVIAAGVLRAWVQAVLGKVPETAQGTVVQAMSVSVASGEVKPIRKALGKVSLQAVVLGSAIVRRPVDILQIGELGDVGTEARDGVKLIDVDEIGQPGAVIGHIANFEREVAAKGVLDIEVPVHHVWGFEIRVHRDDVARRCPTTASKRGAGRKNHTSVEVTTDSWVPVEIDVGDRGVAQHNGAAKGLRTRGSYGYFG